MWCALDIEKLLVAKGQPVPSSVTSVASRPYVTPTPPASEWHHAQPAQQQSNVLESSLEATEENPSLEEEGDFAHFLFF